MSNKTATPLIALALLGAVSLGACSNTLAGAGQDIENAGEEIEETANETHDGNPNTP